jgi:hypothetical protein
VDAVVEEGQKVGVIDDPEAQRDNQKQRLSLEVANTLMDDNPSAVITAVENGSLQGLSADQENRLKEAARNRIARLGEINNRKRLSQASVQFQDFTNKTINGEMTWREADNFERQVENDEDLTDEQKRLGVEFAQTVKSTLTKPRDVRFEQDVQGRVQNIRAREEAQDRAEEQGIVEADESGGSDDPDAEIPSETEKLEKYNDLVIRFRDFTKNDEDELTQGNSLTKLLRYQADVADALDKGHITQSEAQQFSEKVTPVIRKKIENEIEDTWFGGLTSEDVYAPALQQHAEFFRNNPDLNTLENRKIAFRRTIEIADELGLDEQPSGEASIKDIEERRERIRNLGSAVINEFIQSKDPSIRSTDDLPDKLITRDGETINLSSGGSQARADGSVEKSEPLREQYTFVESGEPVSLDQIKAKARQSNVSVQEFIKRAKEQGIIK